MDISVRIQNFKCLEDITIILKPTVFLFGPNGSGKSSFIKAMLFLSENIKERKRNIDKRYSYNLSHSNLESFSNIVHNNDISKTISYEIEVNNTWLNYLELRQSEEGNYCEDGQDDAAIDLLQTEVLEDFILCMQKLDTNLIYKYFNAIDSGVDLKITIEFPSGGLNNMKVIHHYDKYGFFLNATASPSSEEFIQGNINPLIKEFLIEDHYQPLRDIPPQEFFKEYPNKFLEFYLKKERTDISKSEFIRDIILIYKLYVAFPTLMSYYLQAQHFGSIREVPSSRYLLINDNFPKTLYYNFNHFLRIDSNGELFDPDIGFSYKLLGLDQVHDLFSILSSKRWNDVFNYLNKMGLAKRIYTKTANGVGEVIVENMNGSQSYFSDSSSGLIQIFPIINSVITNLIEGGFQSFMLLIEQPELHLHPKIQSRLAELFTHKGFTNDCKIIETHSEHMIRKLQVLIAKGNVSLDDVAVYYFDNNNGKTKTTTMKINEDGFFQEPWPNGFFDESYNLAKELLLPSKN